MSIRFVLAVALASLTPLAAAAQGAPAASDRPPAVSAAPGVELPAGFVLGVEDVVQVSFWKDEEMSADNVVVRPDGKISLPLLNDVQAAGLSPDQLRLRVEEAAAKFVTEPTASVVVKTINSRRVYIDGAVAKRGAYSIIGPMTVVQLIAIAGGTSEYANLKKIQIVRTENGQTQRFQFNYKDYMNGKGLDTNIELKPGDVVTIPE